MPSFILRRPNKLSFPGTKPGFDPAHLASKIIGSSGVAAQGGVGFTNLLTGAPHTPASLTGAFASIDGSLGPAWGRPLAGTGGLTTPPFNIPSTVHQFTQAAIVRPFDLQNGAYGTIIALNDTNGDGLYIQGNGVGVGLVNFFVGVDTFGPATAINIPYFIVCSCNDVTTAGTATTNFLVLNLSTGQITTSVHSGPTGGFSSFTAATINARGISVAAAMTSWSYLNMDQMLQWAQDPWSFWYPQKIDLAEIIRTPPFVPASGGSDLWRQRSIVLRSRPNKLTFPGTKPGIDLTHPAAGNSPKVSIAGNGPYPLWLSAVAIPGQNRWQNLLTGTPLNNYGTGSGTPPTSGIDGCIGPWVNVGSGAAAGFQWGIQPYPTNPSTDYATYGAIFTHTTNTTLYQTLVASWDSHTGVWLQNNKVDVYASADYFSATLTIGHSYFVAASIFFNNQNSTGSLIQFVVKDLTTGAVSSYSYPNASVSSNSLGHMTIGNDTAGEYSATNIAAAMVGGAFLTMPQLLAWADDPWSFWYPQKIDLAKIIRGPSFIPASGGSDLWRQRSIVLRNRPNKLAFPGTRPGIDPSHPASQGCRFSTVAVAGGTHINILNGAPGSVVGSPTYKILGNIGPSGFFNGATDASSFPGQSVTDSNITMAAIVTPITNSTIQVISAAGASNGYLLVINAGQFGLYNLTAGFGVTGLIPVANTPYFFACSIAGSGPLFAVMTNLSNGNIQTSSLAQSFSPSPSAGAWGVGNRPGASNQPFQGYIATTMYSATTISPAQLLEWAQDPWSFWYPQKIDLGDLLRTSAGGPTTSVGFAAGLGAATAIGSSVALATGSATGLGSATATGVAQSKGAAAGLGAASAVGSSVALSTGAATGLGAATATGLSESKGAAAGLGSATATGSSVALSTGAATGLGSATAVGLSESIGAAAGLGSATATGSSVALATGNAAGTSQVNAQTASQGAAAGLSSVNGRAACQGAASGIGSATAISLSAALSVGSATGTGAAAAISGSALLGTAAGQGAANGIGAALFTGVGTTAGLGSASAVGVWKIAATGISAGLGSASAVGASRSTGVAVGTSVAHAISSSIAVSIGAATSYGSANAYAVIAQLPSIPISPSIPYSITPPDSTDVIYVDNIPPLPPSWMSPSIP